MGICAWCWYWDKYQLMATWTVALSSCCWCKRVSGQKQIRKKQQYMQTTRTNCILESVNARANYSISQNRVPQLSSRVLPNISSTLPAGKVGILWSSTEHWRTMCGQWKGISQSDYTLLSMIELSTVCCTVQDMECGYNSPLGSLYRKYSDQQIPIWEASTALYPRLGP